MTPRSEQKPRFAVHRGCALWLLLFAVLLTRAENASAGTPVSLFRSFAGNIQFTGTAGTFRSQSNSGDACALNPSAPATLNTIPAGATVTAAYLYWSGSMLNAADVDATVTFQTPAGSGSVTADRTFDETFSFGGTDYRFFSGFEDVTSQVNAAGNGNYSLSNLTVNNGAPHCGVQAVLAGWSLVVVYDRPVEPLRVINVFDGFEFFRGSQITLTPNNFLTPPSPDGQMAHITWEGDVENSASLNGFNEELRFETTTLTDGLNPTNNQFNSTVNINGATGVYGVDFDSYDVSALMNSGGGETSFTSRYSSGQDLVLLSAEVFSVTNTPVADLAISKTHSGNFGVGVTGTYTLAVTNNGPVAESGPITVTDTLPAGLTYVGAAGTGWTCNEASGTVTCTHAGPLAPTASLPPIGLDVLPDASAVPSVTNTASVSGTLFDNIAANNSASDLTNVVGPDLSTSTKDVLDLDFGDALPGDILRYTINLVESLGGQATGVSVTDDIPSNVTGFTVTQIPAGAIDNSSPTGGASGTGFLDIQNVTVPGGGSEIIEFEVTIAAGTPPGTVISNTATVTNPDGPGATPVAPDVVVSASQVPGSGSKPLYLYGSPGLELSRAPPTGLPPTAADGNVAIDKSQPPVVWTLAEALAAPLAVGGGNFPVDLWLRRGNTSAGSVARTLQLDVTSASAGLLGTVTQAVSVTGTPQLFNFAVVPGAALPTTLPTGDTITLTVTNVTPGGGNRRVRVFPVVLPGGNSQVVLNANTVINVDSVTAFDAAYPGGSVVTSLSAGDPVFVRAVVTDPFGSFDITGATLEIRDPSATPVLTGQAMPEVADSGADTKTYEFAYTLPAAAPAGTWEMRVVADEGLEGTIQDLGLGTFAVGGAPDILVMKSVAVLSDPVLGTTNPKAIPGATIEYTVLVTNAGSATGAAPDVVMTDSLAAEIAAGTLAFAPDAYGSDLGIRVTAPSIGGGAPTALSNATDGDEGEFQSDIVTVNGIALDPGESATVTFQAVVQ